MDTTLEDAARDREETVERERDEVSLDSVTLARLLDEVRNEDTFEAHAYNRMHNRHNR